MGVYNIQYTDYKGSQTDVYWYTTEDVIGKTLTQEYVDRVEADGGTVEAINCVEQLLLDLGYVYDTGSIDAYSFECAGATPLNFRWYGDRYTAINASEINFRVMIRNQTDYDEIQKLLTNRYYCVVGKDGVATWRGKLWPQFFTEAYKQYPFEIEINASDQLGQMKEYTPLMVDFPEPYIEGFPTYRLMDVIGRFLVDEQICPDSTIDVTPMRMRTAVRMWHGEEGKMLEDTYLDPLAFMDENNQYKSKWDILTAILEAFNLRIFQWDAWWYIVSQDAQYDAGKVTYQEYELDRIFIWRGTGTHITDDGILDLYSLQSDNPQATNRQVFNNATMEYLPALQGVNLTQKFVPNTNILPVYANRSGSFFQGDNNQYLEYGPKFEGRATLRHWDYGGLFTDYYPTNNAGALGVNMTIPDDPVVDISKTFTIPAAIDEDILSFRLAFNYDTVYPTDDFIRINVRYTKQGVSRWLYKNNDDEIAWNDEADTLEIRVSLDMKPYEFSAEVQRPLDEFYGESEIYIQILNPTRGNNLWGGTLLGLYTNFLFSALSSEWKGSDYELETTGIFEPFKINPLGSQPPVDKTLTWGMAHPQFSNSHFYHLSSPYYADGNPIRAWLKTGSLGEFPDYRSVVDWILLSLLNNNQTYTPKLKASFRSDEITPMRLIYDFENRIYQFINAEFDDKNGFWSVEYVQAKWVLNVPGQPIKGDFSPIDFNNDFFTLTPA